MQRTAATRRSEFFIRLWGLAMAAHVIGNWNQPDLPHPVAWVNLVVGIVGVALVVRPARPLLIIGSALVVASVVMEMPLTGNHWLVAGLVSLAIVVTGAHERRFFPAARLILLVFYLFAAFAKLNTGFLDPTVSCSVYYANQSLTGFGLPHLDPAAPAATLVIWATVAIELSVPLLLVVRRTRYWGVLVGSGFHILISFDLLQHFYDFTSVLLPLFLLVLPDETIALIAERARRWLSIRSRALLVVFWCVMGGGLVVLAVGPLFDFGLALLKILPFGLWIPFCLLWLRVLLGARGPGQKLEFRLQPATALVVLVTVLNGLTPYFEVKTAYSFNMYANLQTAEGQSNHLIVSKTYPLRNGYRNPVEIVDSSDPGLELYKDQGFLVAYPQLRRYLANHQDVALTYHRGGETVSLDVASDDPEFTDAGPWWWRFLALRAIDQRSPPRCQDVFLPAL